ncbi:FAD-binding oxidoreductase [Angustibacter sp. Root456]|uniref:NAD(P)/FAD-dependent oxidoreductase n=1 Tax=Angustibacter sp. Root456 TaxID=1736539 RepID=UPI0006F69F0E|nr:FAD-dependent oxidoreductase [Angustibacter sp. Root456]KQX61826.1 FAD-dependent oxidoreductase [Angustibacter sp. Root456]
MPHVVVIGAGIVGAACAFYAAEAGLSVTVVDRAVPAAGTTSRGEGNILVSDKGPGPELDLALLSARLWRELGATRGAEMELEAKGGLVVATSDAGAASLLRFAEAQAGAGVETQVVRGSQLRALEPHLAPELEVGVHYPGDLQVQPVQAATALLRRATEHGAHVLTGVTVQGLERDADGHVAAVATSRGPLPADAVVNATGTWAGEVSRRLGAQVPVLPRRGFVLVTEPLPRLVRHKVYSADYVDNVAASSAGLETSAVVEGTAGGTVLIGASRERVGFDPTLSPDVVAQLARQAVALFPCLADVQLMRVYHGFRPYCPDHLPVLGWDPRVPGLLQAAGHEGAGIGLAPATGALIAELITGRPPSVDVAPFDPARFDDSGEEAS